MFLVFLPKLILNDPSIRSSDIFKADKTCDLSIDDNESYAEEIMQFNYHSFEGDTFICNKCGLDSPNNQLCGS